MLLQKSILWITLQNLIKNLTSDNVVRVHVQFHLIIFQNFFCPLDIIIDSLTTDTKLLGNLSKAVIISVVELDIIHLLICQKRRIKFKERIHTIGFFDFHNFYYTKK
ncbi:helix-turn-helix protein, YlxM/p13 family protein [Streptococcus mitis SK321]|nr:helix-turn-helix protein, YlxM/p13 family protein [Streptococcus mitis SK321]